MQAVFNSPLQAPISKGDTVGELKISVPEIGDFNVPLIAAKDVEGAGFFGRAFDKLDMMLSSE